MKHKTKRMTPVPLSGIYDSRHIKKAKGQKTLGGLDSSILLRVKKVRSELDQEINSLGITEKKIIKWRHGGSIIDWKKLSDLEKEQLHKHNALLTAKSIFNRHFEEYGD